MRQFFKLVMANILIATFIVLCAPGAPGISTEVPFAIQPSYIDLDAQED